MTKHPKTTAIVALWASISLLALFAPPASAQTKTGAIFGCSADQLTSFTRIGLVQVFSPNFSALVPLDVGDHQIAIPACAVWTFYIDSVFTLGIMLGPEVTVIADTITAEDKLTYVQAATGFTLRYNFHPDLSLWSAIQIREGDAPIPTIKLTFGLVAWL